MDRLASTGLKTVASGVDLASDDRDDTLPLSAATGVRGRGALRRSESFGMLRAWTSGASGFGLVDSDAAEAAAAAAAFAFLRAKSCTDSGSGFVCCFELLLLLSLLLPSCLVLFESPLMLFCCDAMILRRNDTVRLLPLCSLQSETLI